METTNLQTLQKAVDDWIQKVGNGYFSVLTNTVILMEEVGELSRLVARHYGDQSFKPDENPNPEALGEEMADILFVLLCLANQTGIDLEEAFHKKLALKTQRDAARHAARTLRKAFPSTGDSPPPEAPSAIDSD